MEMDFLPIVLLKHRVRVVRILSDNSKQKWRSSTGVVVDVMMGSAPALGREANVLILHTAIGSVLAVEAEGQTWTSISRSLELQMI